MATRGKRTATSIGRAKAKARQSHKASTITVFDVGCRFGLHPSWAPLKNSPLLRTLAFDPDKKEIARLRRKYRGFENYEAFCLAFGEREETLDYRIHAHRGMSSFLSPNRKGAWFGARRVEDGVLVQSRKVKVATIENFCRTHKVTPDFLKIDTEGFDYHVLKGGGDILDDVLGIRCEVYFDENFVGSPLLDKILPLLGERSLRLANLDYQGRGIAHSYFCPTPSYGILTGCEAVFIPTDERIAKLPFVELMKFVIFCFLNNLSDLAHALLIRRQTEVRKAGPAAATLVEEAKRRYLLGAKSLLNMPGDSYTRAKADFRRIFAEDFPDQHRFFESDFLNPA